MTTGSDAPVLELRGRSAAYGRMTVVRDVDLRVPPKAVVAVLGPNGAGKTSLLESVAGRISGTGEIVLDGERIDTLPTHRRARRGLALVPTGRGLFPGMTVSENLELGGRLAQVAEREEIRERVLGYFPVLRDRLNQSAGSMSGGEQQMLAVAKALVGDPKVLMLDEPTQGLAPKIFGILIEAIELAASSGLGVLLVEQNLTFATRVADSYSVLAGGRIVQEGNADELSERERVFAAYMHEEETDGANEDGRSSGRPIGNDDEPAHETTNESSASSRED